MSKRPHIQIPLTQEQHDKFKLACSISKRKIVDVIREAIDKYIMKFHVWTYLKSVKLKQNQIRLKKQSKW